MSLDDLWRRMHIFLNQWPKICGIIVRCILIFCLRPREWNSGWIAPSRLEKAILISVFYLSLSFGIGSSSSAFNNSESQCMLCFYYPPPPPPPPTPVDQHKMTNDFGM
jgi:hypothetical protein